MPNSLRTSAVVGLSLVVGVVAALGLLTAVSSSSESGTETASVEEEQSVDQSAQLATTWTPGAPGGASLRPFEPEELGFYSDAAVTGRIVSVGEARLSTPDGKPPAVGKDGSVNTLDLLVYRDVEVRIDEIVGRRAEASPLVAAMNRGDSFSMPVTGGTITWSLQPDEAEALGIIGDIDGDEPPSKARQDADAIEVEFGSPGYIGLTEGDEVLLFLTTNFDIRLGGEHVVVVGGPAGGFVLDGTGARNAAHVNPEAADGNPELRVEKEPLFRTGGEVASAAGPVLGLWESVPVEAKPGTVPSR